jgi:hypothetical protein
LSGFVDWLNENGYTICTLEETDGYPEQQYFPHRKPYEEIFADYFGIDLKKVEQERQAILAEIRSKNANP